MTKEPRKAGAPGYAGSGLPVLSSGSPASGSPAQTFFPETLPQLFAARDLPATNCFLVSGALQGNMLASETQTESLCSLEIHM